ncbi:MAG TPA: hypothetical protein VE046_11920 [Steroidobacteraceae bacterium]|nr:hypothetical protein [Steroidobacteraceae bacterium]
MQWTSPFRSVRPIPILASWVVAIALGAAVQWTDLTRLDRAVIRTMHGDIALVEAAARLHEDILQLRRYEKDVFINLGDPLLAADYRSKWDDAYAGLRRDLLRARWVSAGAGEPVLRSFAACVGDYRAGFDRTWELIRSGTITTPQQANGAMSRYKAFVRSTESQIESLQVTADQRISAADSNIAARQSSLGAMLFFTILAALAFGALILRSTPLMAR